MKYYFISYVWKHFSNSKYHFVNALINTHPFEWIAKVNDEDVEGYEYTLINFQEITESEYDQYKDIIN